MKFVADFHLHSKYSRATSPRMDLENLDKWGRIKGIKLLGTGDFTHPVWLKELKEKLEPAESGLFKIKNNNKGTRFILSAEISCIYSKKGRVRKIHTVVLAPSFEIVEKINSKLDFIGNLKADGRPILGLDAKELAKIVLDSSENCLVVPAHVMTPWFSLFGSKSGFDLIEECFEEYTKHIYALETGLSADPSMLWRTAEGQKLTLISNSDAHSPEKIGREANVFDTEISYPAVFEAIKLKDRQKFLYTIEFFPQEGKYHFDGHRSCNVRLSPSETKKYNNICPNCGKGLTVGVLNRIEQIAVKPEGFKSKDAIPFKSLVPLKEIVAEALRMTVVSKRVEGEYNNLLEKLGSELNVLLDVSRNNIEEVAGPLIAEGISRVREGKVFIEPGYDGVYGTVKIFSQQEPKALSKQKTLF